MNIERINVPLLQALALVVTLFGLGVPLLLAAWQQHALLKAMHEEQWTITHNYLFERGLREMNPTLTVPRTEEIDRLYIQLKRQREQR